MNEVKLVLSKEEVNAILSLLGDLPTKTGAWGLLMKIKTQAESGLSSATGIVDESQELNDRIG